MAVSEFHQESQRAPDPFEPIRQGVDGIDRSTVSLVMPCLNEARSVALCVREALETMALSGIDGEVVVVDNGSTDGSAEAAHEAGARVVVERRPGYGSALLGGIQAANGSIIVMADADWSYDLRQIPRLVAPIIDGEADLVLGSRLHAAAAKSMPILHRYLGTPVLTYLVRRAAGEMAVSDSQSGFRAFRREAILNLALKCTGMEFASEMLIRATQEGLRLLDVPTGYRERVGESKLKAIADGWRHLKLIFLIAPQLLLVAPGLALFLLGLALSAMSLLSPAGLEIGSLRWQPVFFSSIILTLGLQSALGGMILSHRSSLVAKSARSRFRFVGTTEFPAACIKVGVAALLVGLGIDGYLFVLWVSGLHAPRPGFGLAALAQSFLMVGGSLWMLGLTLRSWYWNGGTGRPRLRPPS